MSCVCICTRWTRRRSRSDWIGYLHSTEIPDRVEYVPGSGARILFPDAELNLCEAACEPANLTVSVKLATRHIGKGCDRDTYSVESQRKLCGKFIMITFIYIVPYIRCIWYIYDISFPRLKAHLLLLLLEKKA